MPPSVVQKKPWNESTNYNTTTTNNNNNKTLLRITGTITKTLFVPLNTIHNKLNKIYTKQVKVSVNLEVNQVAWMTHDSYLILIKGPGST